MSLTPFQVREWKENGYTIVPDFFNLQEISHMLIELERFKKEGLGRNPVTNGDGKTASNEKINYQIIPLFNKSELLRSLPYLPKVQSALQQLLGPNVVRFLDQIFLKPAQCGVGTNWHTDNAYFKTPIATEGTGLWIALHDAHKENGTMMVIPKSHLKSYPHVRDMGSDHHITCANEIDPAEAELVNVPAGGCIFFNYGVVHATGDNKTHRERAGLAYHFATPKAATQSEWYHTPNNSDMYLVCGEGEGTDLALSNRDVDLSIWK